jgi:FeS assembly SUF system regulator
MLKIAKLTDYGTLVMTTLARAPSSMLNAQELAARSHVAAPTVAKLLKLLVKGGLVESTRGVHGGYRLARSADEITVADVVSALEGPIAITACALHGGGCTIEGSCTRDPPDLGQEERARVAARVPAGSLPPLAHDDRADLAHVKLPADRLPGHHLLLGAQAEEEAASLDEVDPELLRTYEKLGVPLHEQARARRRGGRRDLRLGVGRDHLQGEARRRRRRHLLLVLGGGARASRLVASTWARSCRTSDNFYAALNSAVFTDGSFVFIPKGVRCPMELSTYFRINTQEPGSSSAR